MFLKALLGLDIGDERNLNVGEFWAVRNVSFRLKRGQALGIIGLNGSGKTTLLRLLAGQMLPDGGEIRSVGQIATLMDLTTGFQMNASGRRNIFLRGALLGRTSDEMNDRCESIIHFADLGDAIEAPVSTYSSGMLMRLAFSITVETDPDILIIDEILSVGDFQFRQKCLAKIRDLRARSSFILVSHSLADIKVFCDEAIVLNQGEVAFFGDPSEAVELYEKMQFPEQITALEQKRQILQPQYFNEAKLSELTAIWSDCNGEEISKIKYGSDLFLRIKFTVNYVPRNLIIGVPVWTETGDYVTGFSTDRDGSGVPVPEDGQVEMILKIPDISFNPGVYISNLAIHDGLEFLCRMEHNPIEITSGPKWYFGSVTMKYSWLNEES
tara:strand:- start:926 stop:2074 length:1149 start_codon:yes stop_codon:yes gene_type:complete